jgi:Kazal-type serine protease inhibitor domain
VLLQEAACATAYGHEQLGDGRQLAQLLLVLTCESLCAGRRLLQSGTPPPGDCICTKIFAPVCATDPATKMNITFENACQVPRLAASCAHQS